MISDIGDEYSVPVVGGMASGVEAQALPATRALLILLPFNCRPCGPRPSLRQHATKMCLRGLENHDVEETESSPDRYKVSPAFQVSTAAQNVSLTLRKIQDAIL